MRILAGALATAMLSGAAIAQDLPEAPHRKLDFALLSYDATARALDVTSTQHFLHHGGHENELPPSIANHPAVMSLFEASVIAVETYGAHKLAQHGHPKLARLVPFIDGSACLGQDIFNYRIGYKTVHMGGK